MKAPRSTSAKSMSLAMSIPDWNSLDSVRHVHSELEAAALAFFALLVIFDVLAHLSKDDSRKTLLEKIALWFFAVAVLAEIIAYPYGQRNDTLSAQIIGSLDIKAQRATDNASKALTDSSTALTQSQTAITNAEAAQLATRGVARQTATLQKQADSLREKIEQAHKFADTALARTRPRVYVMDGNKFVEALKGVKPCNVEVLYKREDDEAYELASKIVRLLGAKDGLGWNVSGPRPLKDMPKDWEDSGAVDIPPSTLLTGGVPFGGEFMVRDVPSVGEPRSGHPLWALARALDASGIHFRFIFQDSSLAENTVRIVVLSQFD